MIQQFKNFKIIRVTVLIFLLSLIYSCNKTSELNDSLWEGGPYEIVLEDFQKFKGKEFLIVAPMGNGLLKWDTIQKHKIKDLENIIMGEIEQPMPINWLVKDGDKIINRGEFILEPGTHNMKKNALGLYMLEGKLNDVFYNQLLQDNRYRNYYRAILTDSILTDKGELRQVESYERQSIYKNTEEIRLKYYDSIFYNSSNDSLKQLYAVYIKNDYVDISNMEINDRDKIAQLNNLVSDHVVFQFMSQKLEHYKNLFNNRNKIKIGDKITFFAAPNHQGKIIEVGDIVEENEYVFIDFWASWCLPCRVQIPHLKEIFSKYHDKGFEIVSFSLDENKIRWNKAFEEEQLPWSDLSDLKGKNSPIAKKFGVTSIPDNILVDKNGKVIGKKLRPHQIDKILDSLFINLNK